MSSIDPKSIVMVLGTLALGAGFVVLILRGDIAHAMTVGALLVPSLGQLPAPSQAVKP